MNLKMQTPTNLNQSLKSQRPSHKVLRIPSQQESFLQNHVVESNSVPNLKLLTDDQIHTHLKSLFSKKRELEKVILDHLAEVDARKLYLKIPCPNFFEYLTQELKVEGGSAQRYIDAVRLTQRIPEVSKKLEDGDLTLLQVNKFQQALRQNMRLNHGKVDLNTQENIIKRLTNLNSRQTDLVLAQEFNFKIKDQTRQKIQQDESIRVEITFGKTEYELLLKARNLLSHQAFGDLKLTIVKMAEKTVKDGQPKERKKAEKIDASKDTTPADHSINCTRRNKKSKNPIKVTSPQAEVQGKLVQQNNVTTTQLKLATSTVEVNHRQILGKTTEGPAIPTRAQISASKEQVFAPNTKSSSPETPTKPPKTNKTLTPKTRLAILHKTPSCQYKNHQTGKVCGAALFLEVDHVRPRYAGGAHEEENLRALCRGHNQFRFRNEN